MKPFGKSAHPPWRKFEIRNQKFERMAARRAFVLIEVMLGVMIFAVGVLALGRCVSNCIGAEAARQESERARRALENRMAEVEAGEIPTDKARSDDLGDDFPGMTLKQSRQPVSAKDEKGGQILGLYEVNLEVDWTSENEPESKSISFYVLRSQ
jgi:type II secretory pathway pseudopilin PulG